MSNAMRLCRCGEPLPPESRINRILCPSCSIRSVHSRTRIYQNENVIAKTKLKEYRRQNYQKIKDLKGHSRLEKYLVSIHYLGGGWCKTPFVGRAWYPSLEGIEDVVDRVSDVEVAERFIDYEQVAVDQLDYRYTSDSDLLDVVYG